LHRLDMAKRDRSAESERDRNMVDYPPMDDYDLWLLLVHTRDTMGKVRERELRQYKVSTKWGAVLREIQAIGHNATPRELSRRLFREPHSVSEMVTNMEQAGLLEKTRDLAKKHSVRLSLTDKGRAVYSQVAKRDSIYEIMSCLTDEQRKELRSCLEPLLNMAFEKLSPNSTRSRRARTRNDKEQSRVHLPGNEVHVS